MANFAYLSVASYVLATTTSLLYECQKIALTSLEISFILSTGKSLSYDLWLCKLVE